MRYRSLMVQSEHAGMQAIADMAATGALRAAVHSTLPLSSAAEAHRLGEAGKIDGKLVRRSAERVGPGLLGAEDGVGLVHQQRPFFSG